MRPRFALGAIALLSIFPLTVSTAAETTAYGKELSGAEAVPVASLLAAPQDWVGKTVRVEGAITDVCPRMGCWIDITAEGRTVRFKVKDGEIVFPVESRGRRVVAEGMFARMELDGEQAIAHARHEAEERGRPFDPAAVELPLVIYRIEGLGALVE